MFTLRIPRKHGRRVLSPEVARDFRKNPGVKSAATFPNAIVIQVTEWKFFLPIVATMTTFFKSQGLDPALLQWELPADK